MDDERLDRGVEAEDDHTVKVFAEAIHEASADLGNNVWLLSNSDFKG